MELLDKQAIRRAAELTVEHGRLMRQVELVSALRDTSTEGLGRDRLHVVYERAPEAGDCGSRQEALVRGLLVGENRRVAADIMAASLDAALAQVHAVEKELRGLGAYGVRTPADEEEE